MLGSQVGVASDYHKKKNVFRLNLASGSEYLMHAKSADEMSLWIQHIRGSCVDPNASDEELKKRLSGSFKHSSTVVF